MNRLYKKSELWFSLLWIGIYVFGSGLTDELSRRLNAPKLVTLNFHAILSIFAILWMEKNGLLKKYGICTPAVKASKFLYYLPLIFVASHGLWFGVSFEKPVAETLALFLSMVLVGFLEELIFRGFLFKAMSKDNLKLAVVVSSLSFGLGHLVNLINGSGMSVTDNLCQVLVAVAFGFMCVLIFHRGKSLVPCIAVHSAYNALGAFSAKTQFTERETVLISLVLSAVIVLYTLFLLKSLPKNSGNEN
ncbi:MAG: CPBP family intramembrane metalloprotease [Clostridia bacterium]|nr:CPBP family intramembrane metalloprotease [Clostridia bacterium]